MQDGHLSHKPSGTDFFSGSLNFLSFLLNQDIVNTSTFESVNLIKIQSNHSKIISNYVKRNNHLADDLLHIYVLNN
jgi:hypothetical protein